MKIIVFLDHLWKDINLISNFIASRYLLLIYNFNIEHFIKKFTKTFFIRYLFFTRDLLLIKVSI